MHRTGSLLLRHPVLASRDGSLGALGYDALGYIGRGPNRAPWRGCAIMVRVSEGRLAFDVFDRLPLPLFVLDRAGGLLGANRAYLELVPVSHRSVGPSRQGGPAPSDLARGGSLDPRGVLLRWIPSGDRARFADFLDASGAGVYRSTPTERIPRTPPPTPASTHDPMPVRRSFEAPVAASGERSVTESATAGGRATAARRPSFEIERSTLPGGARLFIIRLERARSSGESEVAGGGQSPRSRPPAAVAGGGAALQAREESPRRDAAGGIAAPSEGLPGAAACRALSTLIHYSGGLAHELRNESMILKSAEFSLEDPPAGGRGAGERDIGPIAGAIASANREICEAIACFGEIGELFHWRRPHLRIQRVGDVLEASVRRARPRFERRGVELTWTVEDAVEEPVDTVALRACMLESFRYAEEVLQRGERLHVRLRRSAPHVRFRLSATSDARPGGGMERAGAAAEHGGDLECVACWAGVEVTVEAVGAGLEIALDLRLRPEGKNG